MKPEETQELKELIEFLKEHNIGEFDLERGDLKVRIKFAQETGSPDLAQMARLLSTQQQAPAIPVLPQVHAAAAAAPAAEPPAEQGDAGEDASLHVVKSPIVGTFYESPSPGSPPFVKVGDQVENGQVLCIIEAMKLMNEIECDAAGEIVKRFVQGGQPVEYGQSLFAVRPR
ncbi:MAG TPA: acetyl-CoA carboxylase biotin carboxyl carrier protein [Silvibacterium sp.]|nr:acetyl-CoA carboxylase biotin carboxyl carrier protein [Silvibacterium sp.]